MRCKFKVDSITRQKNQITKLNPDGSVAIDERGRRLTEHGETWTVEMSPVYANEDPTHENSLFWAYTPGGSFKMSTVNKAAVEKLDLGMEVYIDITPAGAP